MAARLRAAGFNDLIVLGEGANANGIALGRYGSEESARRRETELKAKIQDLFEKADTAEIDPITLGAIEKHYAAK